MRACQEGERPFEKRHFEARLRVSTLEGGIRLGPLDHHEGAAAAVEIAVEIRPVETTEVRTAALIRIGWDLRRMLEWVDPIGVGPDAPGPQSRLELTPFQQATL